MGKTERSEVTIVIGDIRTNIPLHLLTSQSKKIAAVAYPPIEEIVFPTSSAAVVKQVLYFCRSGLIKNFENLDEILEFAKLWELHRLYEYLEREKKRKKIQAADSIGISSETSSKASVSTKYPDNLENTKVKNEAQQQRTPYMNSITAVMEAAAEKARTMNIVTAPVLYSKPTFT